MALAHLILMDDTVGCVGILFVKGPVAYTSVRFWLFNSFTCENKGLSIKAISFDEFINR